MTRRYPCPYCKPDVFEGRDRFLNHLFGWHKTLIRERLALSGSHSTHKDTNPPPWPLETGLTTNSGVSGEGDSS